MTEHDPRIPVELLVVGGHVLTMDPAFADHRDGAIAVAAGRIVAVGSRATVEGRYRADRVLDAGGGLILPGLVNTHCHAAMTLFRGLADDVALADFLATVWQAEDRFVAPQSVRIGATLACLEMALGGITTVADMYWHPAATVAAAQAVGIGLVTGPVMFAFPGADRTPSWEARLEAADAFLAGVAGLPSVHATVAPHGCYTLDEAKLRDVAAMCRRLGVPMQIHAAEAQDEMRQVQDIYGRRPVAVLHDTGLLDAGGVIAHGVHLDDGEIALLARHGTGIAHCPLSNAKTAAGVARVIDLLDHGVAVGLGTDGAATGNDLDLWKAMRFCGLQQRLANDDPRRPSARDLLRMATIDGARALGLAQETGSLEPGKRGDIIVVSTDAPHMQPVYDPYATLAYAAGREDVRHVVANGHLIVENRTAVRVPVEEAMPAFRQLAARIAIETGLPR